MNKGAVQQSTTVDEEILMMISHNRETMEKSQSKHTQGK